MLFEKELQKIDSNLSSIACLIFTNNFQGNLIKEHDIKEQIKKMENKKRF